MLRKKSIGQSTVEYIVLITVVLGALLAMGQYLKRGFSGRWRAAMDDMGDQYDPRFGSANVVHSLLSNTETFIRTINITGGAWTSRRDLTNTLETKRGITATGAY